jgi:hypothetical protein
VEVGKLVSIPARVVLPLGLVQHVLGYSLVGELNGQGDPQQLSY